MTEEKITKKLPVWPTPYNISLETLDTIVRGFFQAKADSQPVSLESICNITGLYKTTVGANVRFLQALKVVKSKDGTDGYIFESKGAEYAKAVSAGDISKQVSLLKELIADSPLKELADFVKLKKSIGKLDYEALFMQIKTMARIKDNPNYPRGVSAPRATGISTLIELLKRADLVPQDIIDDKKEATPKVSKPPTPKRKRRKKKAPTPVPAETSETTEEPVFQKGENLPFVINITVEAKDAESIKELINLLRELRQLNSK